MGDKYIVYDQKTSTYIIVCIVLLSISILSILSIISILFLFTKYNIFKAGNIFESIYETKFSKVFFYILFLLCVMIIPLKLVILSMNTKTAEVIKDNETNIYKNIVSYSGKNKYYVYKEEIFTYIISCILISLLIIIVNVLVFFFIENKKKFILTLRFVFILSALLLLAMTIGFLCVLIHNKKEVEKQTDGNYK